MRKVFVLEKTKYPLSKLEKFGDVIILFTEHEQRSGIWASDFAIDVVNQFKKKGADWDKDLVVFTGHQIPMLLMFGALKKHVGEFNALLYNATEQDYVERRL